MQKKIIFPILFLLIILIVVLVFRKCNDPEPEFVTVDTIVIEKIDTVFTTEYIILTTTTDSIFKKIRKPKESKDLVEPSDTNKSEETHSNSEDVTNSSESENSGSKKNPDKAVDESNTKSNKDEQSRKDPPNTLPTIEDILIDTSTSVTIDTFLNLKPLNEGDEAIMTNEPINAKSVANYNIADNSVAISPYNKFSQNQIMALDSVVIPIKFHDILPDDGNGAKVYPDHLAILIDIKLNQKFKNANIQFVQCGNINYIRDSELYNFPKLDYNGNQYNFEYLESIMAKHNVPNVLNFYLAGTMSGVAGFYPGEESKKHPESMVMIVKDYLMHGIPEHEIGHWLFLRHTHHSDDPNKISSELVDRTNCTVAGDKLCDTKADPNLTNRVSKNCQYNGSSSLKDAKGIEYNPDVKNVMSYTISKCKKQFTNEQLKRMAILARSDRRNFISQEQCFFSIEPANEANTPEEARFSDVNISDIQIKQQKGEIYDITITVVNDGKVATPSNEGIKVIYKINGKKSNNELMIPSLTSGETEYFSFTANISPKDTLIEVEVEVAQSSNEQNVNNNTYVRFKKIDPVEPNDGEGPEVTPVDDVPIDISNVSKECPTSTPIKINQTYQVKLDFSASKKGFWLSFYVPQNRMVKRIKLSEVSKNFDPVVGVKSNCAYANFIPDDYNENTNHLLNSNGLGEEEIFYTNFNGVSIGNNGWYHVYISHNITNQAPKASFKLKVE